MFEEKDQEKMSLILEIEKVRGEVLVTFKMPSGKTPDTALEERFKNFVDLYLLDNQVLRLKKLTADLPAGGRGLTRICFKVIGGA